MSNQPRTSANHLLHRLFDEGTLAGLADAELVERHVANRDPDAFAALVARHGPMVMAVCRGIVGPHGGEDAFQATFLVLLNRIGTFAVGESLGGWLYRVAGRVARQERVAEARRRRRERVAGSRVGPTGESTPERAEVADLIRREVDRLPERLRAPVVLCDLGGLTRNEAAAVLGCPAGTVGGRLARAHRRLRDQLRRRGIAPSVVVPALAESGSWRTTLGAAIRTAAALGVGTPASSTSLGLAASTTRATAAFPIKATLALALVPCLAVAVAVAVALVAGPRAAVPLAPPVIPPPLPPSPVGPPANQAPLPETDPDDPKLAGHFAGRVTGPDDRPLAGARLYIVPDRALAEGLGPVRAVCDGAGRFQFDAADMTFTALDGLPARRQGFLVAAADGYAPDGVVSWGRTNSTFRSHTDPVRGADLVLRLVRDDVPIRGRILDEGGRPLAGARVRLTTLQVPWKHDLDAYLKKYALSKNEVLMFDHDRTMAPGLLPGVDRETTTDGDGRFRLAGLGNDRLATLEVSARGMVERMLAVMTRDAPDIHLDLNRAILGANFTLSLRAGRTLTGVVRDRDTKQPIAGMLVGPQVIERLKRGDTPPLAVTDAAGRFRVEGIDPVLLDFTVPAPDPAGWPHFQFQLDAVAPPGVPYALGSVTADKLTDLVIECARGIPFRLRISDDAGTPVDARVIYYAVTPNPHLGTFVPAATLHNIGYNPLNRAARREHGVYEGFVIPGPGAVFVDVPQPHPYRPAHVDPKAFFAPGKTDWTNQQLYTEYGTQTNLTVGLGSAYQATYAAIVLVNPPVGSGPLELAATVVRDRPRLVSLVDPEGRPVVGAVPWWFSPISYSAGPLLRAATFPLTRVPPGVGERITFLHTDRKLVGFLMARAEEEQPVTIRMEPWATLAGRLLDEEGRALNVPPAAPIMRQNSVGLAMSVPFQFDRLDDPGVGAIPAGAAEVDAAGRFRIDRLVPGQRYSLEVYRDTGMDAGPAFEDVVLQPGEVRDLGDIRTRKPVDVRGR